MSVRLKSRRASTESDAAPVVTRPRYELRTSGPQTDLVCVFCRRVMAYAVPTAQAEADAGFYVDLHAPGCLRVSG